MVLRTSEVKAVQFDNIPDSMKDLNYWLLWKVSTEPKADKNGEIYYDKIPCTIHGDRADYTDSKNWYSFKEVEEAYQTGKFSGLGFVMADSHEVYTLDLDGVTEHDILNGFKQVTYCEYSPSLEGVHAYFTADKPKEHKMKVNHKGTDLELFSKNKFVTVTGDQLKQDDITDITECNDTVSYLIDTIFKPRGTQKKELSFTTDYSKRSQFKDSELLEKMFKSKNGDKIKALYDGDMSAHNDDPSAADMALANHLAWWSNKDIELMYSLFSQSKLWRADGSKRRTPEQYDDYIYNYVLQPAIDNTEGGYDPGAQDFKISIKDEGQLGSFKHNEDGTIKKLLSNLRVMLQRHPKAKDLKFNEFSQEVTLKGVPVTDSFLIDLRLYVSDTFYMNFSKEDILQMVDNIARERPYHPVKQMIESKDWDGIERADRLFIDYLGADDNEYTRAVTRKWLAGAVARIYEPGIKFEMVPVLQGKQGVGKSTIADKLGGDYFLDTLQSLGNTKDDYQLLIGNWIIELAELSSMSDTKIEMMKAFISAREDKIRLPYQRIAQNYKRTSVFIGTTNPGQYLRDTTGNRRFFPIPLNNKPTQDIFKIDSHIIQQVWAESYMNYTKGEQLYLGKDIDIVADEYREEAKEQNMILQQIDDYLDMKVPRDWNTKTKWEKRSYFDWFEENGTTEGDHSIDKTNVKELLHIVGMKAKDYNTNAKTKQISMHMDSKEDWQKKRVKMNGQTKWGYKRV